MTETDETRRVVGEFLAVVRSGEEPDRAGEFMASSVLAHQVQSEAPVTVVRTPADYAEHVREMVAEWGPFTVNVEELLVEGSRAYVRLVQDGREQGTGRPVRQINSVVYRVEEGRIAEYWIQIDRAGLTAQTTA